MLNKLEHAMLDLETWGTKPGCAIRSIGAVMFDPNGHVPGPSFYYNVADEGQEHLSREPGTIAWWDQQSDEAKKALAENQRPLTEVVHAFHQWCAFHKVKYLWCHGATFDAPIWEHIAEGSVPWKFWNIRDTRTAYDLLGVNLKGIPRVGTHHNALDDCLHQVKGIQLGMTKLSLGKLAEVANG